MNIELQFCMRVVRNALILAGLYFISVWATTQELNFLTHIKPVLIFMFTYILTELAKRYNLDTKNKNNIKTLIF